MNKVSTSTADSHGQHVKPKGAKPSVETRKLQGGFHKTNLGPRHHLKYRPSTRNYRQKAIKTALQETNATKTNDLSMARGNKK